MANEKTENKDQSQEKVTKSKKVLIQRKKKVRKIF